MAGDCPDSGFGPSQVSIAVGLAAFACVLLVVLFIMINKYGRRSKFGMKGKWDFHWRGSRGGTQLLLITGCVSPLPWLSERTPVFGGGGPAPAAPSLLVMMD